MTVALLFALSPTPDAQCAALLDIDGEPIVARLARQLTQNGVDRVAIVTTPQWAEAVTPVVGTAAAPSRADVRGVEVTQLSQALDEFVQSVDDRIVICHADIVTHDGIVAGLLKDPRVRSGILSSGGRIDGDPFRVSMQQGRVISAESPFHAITDPTSSFLSLLVVHRDDRHHLLAATAELRALTADGRPDGWDAELARKTETWGAAYTAEHASQYHLADQLDRLGPGPGWQPDAKPIRAELDDGFHQTVVARAARAEHDLVALTLVALTRTPITLRSAYLRQLYWRRPAAAGQATDAQRRLRAIDEEKELLNSSVKADDGFFTTFFVSPYSKYIARWTAGRRLTPNQVTTFSLLLAVLAALAFSVGRRSWDIVGAVLLQVSFTFDCVDGQLARFSRQFSTLGAWLDSVFDRAKEGAVFVGLAFGGLARGEDVWHLAIAALAFQAVRHYLDFSWAAQQHVEIAAVELAPLAQPQDTRRAPRPRVWPPEPVAAGGVAMLASPGAAPIAAPSPSRATQVRRGALKTGVRAAGVAARALRFSRGSRLAHWLKKMIVLPIGERLALISIAAVIGGPRLVFQALIVWGAVATVYMLGGRFVRSV